MLRNFTTIVNETVNEAYENGINLFLETLEADIQKDIYISENGIETVIQETFSADADAVVDDVESIEESNEESDVSSI